VRNYRPPCTDAILTRKFTFELVNRSKSPLASPLIQKKIQNLFFTLSNNSMVHIVKTDSETFVEQKGGQGGGQ